MNKYGVGVSENYTKDYMFDIPATIETRLMMTETIAATLGMNTSDDLAFKCFIVVAIVILIFWVISRLKGKVEIELPKRRYDPGEKICGSVNLISHKRLEMERFYVALICCESIGEGSGRQIYREEHNLAEARTLLPGNNKRFEFSFLLPGGEDTQEMTELSKNITGGLEAVANVTSAMKKHPHCLSWSVYAGAEIPGIDIWDKKSIRINKIS
tara:strand:- start:4 stop:642 length:639 start_codon:yes stop_codon:yes gene_type:complete